MPAIYNDSRVCERPIPAIIPNALNDMVEEYVYDDGQLDSDEYDTKPVFEEIQLEDADLHAFEALFIEEIGSANTPVIENDPLIQDNFHANGPSPNNIPNEHVSIVDQALDPTDGNPQTEIAQDSATSTGNLFGLEVQTTHKLDDSLEFTYTSENDFQPMVVADGFEIKANDALTNNWPFKQNVKQFFISLLIYYLQ